jgi:fumarate hydratase class II
MNNDFRIEADSMGEMKVPADAYYGAQTARAVENFPISNLRFSRQFIRALGLIKKHAAATNAGLGYVPAKVAQAVQQAAQEVIDGKWDHQFVVDIFQTGSGTSTNMNTNEVIANRASELLGGKRGDKSVHPNDHVNCGQSSNDVIPTAIHLATLDSIVHQLIPALNELHAALLGKAQAFGEVLKIGRTHLQDATPIRLGQEFSGYASQVEHGINRLWAVEANLGELALGGTAVGTGINTHIDFARKTIEGISNETGLNLCEAKNHFEAQGARDACVETSGALKTVAVSLIKIANDIRLLGSGPRCGIGELKLPATQPGSSIMPGKVNPVMCEMLIQVGAQVIGNDAVITFSGTFGNFELNVMLPVIAHNLLQAIELLTSGSRVFANRCVKGLEADVAKCEGNIENSLAMCTSLAPVIGYDKAAKIAKQAYESGRTIRQVALEVSGLDKARLDQLMDARSQTEPGTGAGGSAGG